jgi:hypothetical protein
VVYGGEGIPQRLKPNSLQSIYVRAEARTLQENEFFRSLLGLDRFELGIEPVTAQQVRQVLGKG